MHQRFVRCFWDEKKQLIHRLPAAFVRQILRDFNRATLDADSAAARLGVSRTRVYELRTEWLKDQSGYEPGTSGGDRSGQWPSEVVGFLQNFLPVQSPPNFQLVADELERLHHFKRARSTVESYVKTHLAHLIPSLSPNPASTVGSGVPMSGNFGSMTARSIGGGRPPKNRLCC